MSERAGGPDARPVDGGGARATPGAGSPTAAGTGAAPAEHSAPAPGSPGVTPSLAMVLGGGGARSAYQAGVLRGLAKLVPDFEPSILTGVSAGGINTAHWANHEGTPEERAEAMVRLWSELEVADVFDVGSASLFWRVLRAGWRLTLGRPNAEPFRSMVDTTPLWKTLEGVLRPEKGVLAGIERNLAAGRLRAVALTATRYDTGQTVTFFSGKDIEHWKRPQRRSVHTPLAVRHVMASAALPLFFPAITVDGAWYGDGGIRLVAPLAPALHLGASHVLVVSTRYGRSRAEADEPSFLGYPTPAQVAGTLYSAIFLDALDHDAMQLGRINDLVRAAPTETELREVKLCVLRPSRDLGKLASQFEARLPKTFAGLVRRLGAGREKSADFLSTVLFQSDYASALIECGEADVEARAEEIRAFLAG